MAVPVRINEDNYVRLQNEATKERRSIVAQVNHILDNHFGHLTGSIVANQNTVRYKVDNETDLVIGKLANGEYGRGLEPRVTEPEETL